MAAKKHKKAKAKRKVKKTRKVKAKKVKKAAKPRAAKAPTPVGKVVHYYDRIGVGIIELRGTLAMGDSVTIQRGDQKFSQAVSSMQINHQPVSKAGRGDVIGLKVKKPVKEGAVVLKG